MKTALITILALSLLFNVGMIYFIFKAKPASPDSNLAVKFPYLSSRLRVNDKKDLLINFTKLRSSIRDYVEPIPNSSVYFEYLPTGISIGVNEKTNFLPASLLKVPIVMAIYKKIEYRQLSKYDKVIITKNMLDMSSGILDEKSVGQSISIYDAIKLTLIQSDNTAKNVLLSQLKNDELDFVFDSLDIPKVDEQDKTVVTTKNYASILRTLYLSSYLPNQDSNEILTLLTQTAFSDKIPAGLPDEVKIAHKIGIHPPTDTSSNQPIFSDCGIIYIPKRPFILCMMYRGPEHQARSFMKNISSIAYSYIASLKSSNAYKTEQISY